MSGLRILIVNHCHPATPHVCATRAREFADALTRRGNAVLLATEARGDADTWESASALEDGIRDHDWSRPLVVACRPVAGMRAAKARQGLFGPVRGPLAIALAYLRQGTVFSDWTAGARAVPFLLSTTTVLIRLFSGPTLSSCPRGHKWLTQRISTTKYHERR